MEYYDKYVPSVYIPEINVYLEILQTVHLYEEYEQLPRLWTDLVGFEMVRNDVLVNEFTRLMAQYAGADSRLKEQFTLIAKEVMRKYHAATADERMVLYNDFK